jgi:hypothetical protein
MQSSLSLRSLIAAAALAAAGAAQADPVALTKLTGVAGGGAIPNTAVYKASLGALSGSFAAISISDVSGGFGGAAGQFTGFDLDAIKLSTTNCADAACAQAAGGLSVFDFISGIVFSPGTQRAPADAKLFGTGAGGTTVDNAVATLGLSDAVSSTGPDAAGFVSMGDNGSIVFNLTALVSTAGLYLYIGEVGDNGEVAGSNINLLQNPVPEPSTYALMLAGLGAIGWLTRRQRRGGR